MIPILLRTSKILQHQGGLTFFINNLFTNFIILLAGDKNTIRRLFYYRLPSIKWILFYFDFEKISLIFEKYFFVSHYFVDELAKWVKIGLFDWIVDLLIGAVSVDFLIIMHYFFEELFIQACFNLVIIDELVERTSLFSLQLVIKEPN